MKRILICGILSLAAVGMAFAQWPDGFSVSGELKTGVRADFLSGEPYDKGDRALDYDDKNMFSFWHDDAGNRLNLIMKYEQENFGFKFAPRWDWKASSAVASLDPNDLNGSVDTVAKLPNAYGWFDLMNHMVRITAGNIDDSVWNSPTPEDVHYSTGNGTLRVEVMPIDGLNIGWALGRNVPYQRNGDNEARSSITKAFASSSFGAKYTSEMFTVAAGLELRAGGAERRGIGWGFGGRSDPMNVMFVTAFGQGANANLPSGATYTSTGFTSGIGYGTDASRFGAASAYLGFEVKPIQGLTVQAGGQVGNIDDTKSTTDMTSWLWLNEKIAYDLGGITPRLTAHQKMFIGNMSNFGSDKKWVSPDGDKKDNLPAYLEFVPGVDFSVADNLSAYVEFPVKLWDKAFDISAKPGVNYSFGPGFELGCYYQFILSGATYDNKAFDMDPAIRNAVQINFNWSF